MCRGLKNWKPGRKPRPQGRDCVERTRDTVVKVKDNSSTASAFNRAGVALVIEHSKEKNMRWESRIPREHGSSACQQHLDV